MAEEKEQQKTVGLNCLLVSAHGREFLIFSSHLSLGGGDPLEMDTMRLWADPVISAVWTATPLPGATKTRAERAWPV